MAFDKSSVRIGDTVLIRYEVVPTTQGSTRDLYPGVSIVPGAPPFALDRLDVVSVTQGHRIGDNVTFDLGKRGGEIVALSPAEIEPQQAWIKSPTDTMFVSRPVKSLKRV